jgi:hypothetical protein
MSTLIMSVTTYDAAAGGSPFAGIVPLFDIFGSAFTSWWKKLFAGLLAILLIFTGARLVMALAGMHKATDSAVAGQVDAAKSKAGWAAAAFGGVVCFVPLTVAFFTAIG